MAPSPMLDTLRSFFDGFIAPQPGGDAATGGHAMQLAVAVLLVEVMRAEPAIEATERLAVTTALRERFALAETELAALVEIAQDKARGLHDYHQFTSLLNEHFTQPQKVAMVQAMWQVAYADAHLGAHENHLISKIAGLLHVTHGEYIGAKMRAKEAGGLL
jgi:uncharacterized tellurite resistance protein B-like protein